MVAKCGNRPGVLLCKLSREAKRSVRCHPTCHYQLLEFPTSRANLMIIKKSMFHSPKIGERIPDGPKAKQLTVSYHHLAGYCFVYRLKCSANKKCSLKNVVRAM